MGVSILLLLQLYDCPCEGPPSECGRANGFGGSDAPALKIALALDKRLSSVRAYSPSKAPRKLLHIADKSDGRLDAISFPFKLHNGICNEKVAVDDSA